MYARAADGKLAPMPTRRSHITAALAAGAAVLALPAVASAAGPMVISSPIKVKAYKMSVVAGDNMLSTSLLRSAGSSSQTHYYSASKGVKVKVAKSLASGTVTAPLGSYGTVKLKLKGTGPLKTIAPPKGCTGSKSKSRAGVLTGTFKLKADGGSYFGTIRKTSLPVTVMKGGAIKCTTNPGTPGTPGGNPSATTLSRMQMDGAQMTSYTATKSAGKVTQSVLRMEDSAATAPLQVMHMISATGGVFDTASDFSSASVTGAGQFITGKLAFTSDSGYGSGAVGTATGDLTARFDSIGGISLTAGDEPTTIQG
jgi:hypothetical protein